MDDFILSNNNSLVLNFLIFTYNVHLNKRQTSTDRFPAVAIQSTGLLDFEEFKDIHKLTWNKFIQDEYYVNEKISFVTHDVKYFQNIENFQSLYEFSSEGQKRFIEIRDLFVSWWWKQPYGGNYILNKLTEDFIPTIYDKLLIISEKEARKIKPGNYSIQFIYDDLPDGYLQKSSFFIVENIGKFQSMGYEKKLLSLAFYN